MKTYLVLAVTIVTTVVSQMLFKKGVSLWGELDLSLNSVIGLIPRIFQNAYIVAGMFFFGVSFLLWLFVLSKLDLSFVYPITSLNFVLLLVLSWLLLGESLTLFQLFGVGLILAGIFVLWRSTF